MKEFEYAAPRTEEEVVDLLGQRWGETEVLAGGTDLVGLMKKMIVTPERVVNVKEVRSMQGIEADSTGIRIGAVTTLEELLDSPQLDAYPGIKQAIRGINSMQMQCQMTVGGELCQRPACWYFRNGYGLLAGGGKPVAEGANHHHAILGNQGPARFVSASRLAPVLISLDAAVRIVGPKTRDERLLPLASFYRTPRAEHQRETVLEPNQLVTHIVLPAADGIRNATYEVRHGEGPDHPLASAAAALRIEGGIVRAAQVVMGQVAPVPWVSPEAADALLGRTVDEASAMAAGEAAVSRATPLSQNAYKVQLARTAVKRAVLLAAGLETGGF